LAAEFGYRIKLLGIAKCHRAADGSERIEARVQPTMVPISSLLANVDGAMNAVEVRGNAVGPTLYYGAGAGEMPTASAVVADLMEIAREIKRGGSGPVAPLSYLPKHIEPKPVVSDAELSGRAFLRMTARDNPGILGLISTTLGDEGVAIESILAREQAGTAASTLTVIVLTRIATEEALHSALHRISALSEISGSPRLIRIEEEV